MIYQLAFVQVECTSWFYLTVVNKILRHCHTWLARQYISIVEECVFVQPKDVNNKHYYSICEHVTRQKSNYYSIRFVCCKGQFYPPLTCLKPRLSKIVCVFPLPKSMMLWFRLILRQSSSVTIKNSAEKYISVNRFYKIEPWHVISNNVVCATSKGSDQPAHTRRLTRAFVCHLNILWLLSYWPNIIWSF